MEGKVHGYTSESDDLKWAETMRTLSLYSVSTTLGKIQSVFSFDYSQSNDQI